MMFPKEVSRITSHKKPRYQLYQPGFNDRNSCWLEGEWINLPEKEWLARKDDHERMYASVGKDRRKQHHRDEPTSFTQMTDAQRQAWNHYRGNDTIEGRHQNGSVGPYGVRFAGNRINQKDLAHMKKIGWKAFRRCRLYPNGDVIEQAEKFDLPEEILLDEDGAVNVTAEVVSQNRRAEMEIFEGCLKSVSETMSILGATKPEAMFEAQMAAHSVVSREEEMIQLEWDDSRGKPDPYVSLPDARQEYAEMRRKGQEAIGDAFDGLIVQQRTSHNSCARANLDNTDGSSFSFVLPEFNDDGTHPPVGERDVPWNSRKDN